jgi:hypothetical protein
LPRCLALIAAVFFEHGHDEAFLKLTDRFRIEDIAFVHLKDECFQLIFHLLPRFRTFTAQQPVVKLKFRIQRLKARRCRCTCGMPEGMP